MKRSSLFYRHGAFGFFRLNSTTLRLGDMLTLFHALAGLSIGVLRGMRYGVFPCIGSSMLGSVVGFLTGFLVVHAPRLVNSTATRVFRQHYFFASFLAAFGYLLWLAFAISFWWLCFSLVSR